MSVSRVNKEIPLKPSRYDTLISTLIALITVKAFAVLSLFLVWMFQESPKQQYPPDEDGLVRKPAVVIDDLDDSELEPGAKDFPEVEPTLKLESEFEALQDQVSSILASENRLAGKGDRFEGPAIGHDDRRGVPETVIAPYKRWRVQFEIANREQYRKLLDHFEIEVVLAADKSPTVWRVTSLSTNPTAVATDRDQVNEDVSKGWLTFVNANPRQRDWDFEIAVEAGAPVKREFVGLQLYPPALRERIGKLESAFLAQSSRQIDEVRKTHLRIVADGDGFAFVVDRCEYR